MIHVILHCNVDSQYLDPSQGICYSILKKHHDTNAQLKNFLKNFTDVQLHRKKGVRYDLQIQKFESQSLNSPPTIFVKGSLQYVSSVLGYHLSTID